MPHILIFHDHILHVYTYSTTENDLKIGRDILNGDNKDKKTVSPSHFVGDSMFRGSYNYFRMLVFLNLIKIFQFKKIVIVHGTAHMSKYCVEHKFLFDRTLVKLNLYRYL